MTCQHLNFNCYADVGRLHEEGNPNKIVSHMVDIKINCRDCGLPFEFIGIPNGMSFYQPMLNIDNTELRAPIKPSTDPVEHAKVIINQPTTK